MGPYGWCEKRAYNPDEDYWHKAYLCGPNDDDPHLVCFCRAVVNTVLICVVCYPLYVACNCVAGVFYFVTCGCGGYKIPEKQDMK